VGGVPVDLGLTLPETSEVGAVEDQDRLQLLTHPVILSRAPGGLRAVSTPVTAIPI